MTFDELCLKLTEKTNKFIRTRVEKIDKWFSDLGKDLVEDIITPVGTFCFCAALIVIPIAVVALPFYYISKSCEWRWEESKYEYKWEIPGGCKIKTINGGWAPEENVVLVPEPSF